jgi:hypothetical protein
MKKTLTIITAALVLAGCANGYRDFYREIPGATPGIIAKRRVAPAPDAPIVDHSGLNPHDIIAQYGEQGYGAIGYSSFNGGKAAESGAIEQGKKVGADIVVISNPQYTGTRSSVIPIVTPTTSTSYTAGSATAYGRGGPVTAYGSSSTTSYGSQTNYIPVNTDRFDYAAVYMVKLKSYLGIRYRDLTPEERGTIQSNRGSVVALVVKGSNAFRADILTGDIILAVNGERVDDSDALGKMIEADRGTDVRLSIRRGSEVIEKTVPVNP